jgi:hypothetical protein
MAVADWLSAVAAAASAVAAGFALRTAKRANFVAQSMTSIEASRWHRERKPEIKVWLEPGQQARSGSLVVKLVGPPGLEYLDVMSVRLKDDMPERREFQHPSRTQGELDELDELDKMIWGPCRFRESTEGVSDHGKSATKRNLLMDEQTRFSLEPSFPASWLVQRWDDDQEGKPIRWSITCVRDPDPPWVLVGETTTDSTSDAGQPPV